MNDDSTSPLAAARVILRPKKALPFFGRHPWVLDSAIDRVEPTSIASEHFLDLDGQVVDLVSDKGKFIARGFFNSQSRIRVRLFTWNAEEPLDEALLRRRLAAAIELRRQLGYLGDRLLESTDACRLVFSEADGLSGLIVDRYGDCLAIQPTSLAIAQRLETIVATLQELLAPRAIVLRSEKSMAQLEGAELVEGHVWGELPAGPLVIYEHGLAYEVDLHVGQKTGFYLDQRENRRVASSYLRGRRVLDLFCYTGGFAMNAARAGAIDVLGVDTSKKAVAQAARNAELNQLTGVRFDTGDGFQTLDRLGEQGEKFGAVVLDPPKFARGKGGLNQALMAYHRLNRSAVGLLEPGGILVTCSCTGSVSREDFVLMLSGVAQKTGRDIRILEQRGPAPDHPVAATCLETDYLKCLICQIQ